MSMPHPPPFEAVPGFTKKFRFTASSGVGNSVTVVQLLRALVAAVSATTVVSILQAVKLLKVEVWGPVPTPPAISNISLLWGDPAPGVAGLGTSGKVVSDTAMGTASPPHFSARPDPKSWAADWLSDPTTDGLFYLTCGANSVVDLTLSCTLASIAIPPLLTVTNLNTNSIGQILGGYIAGNTLKPAFLQTYTP
jgi:hypothetical protein